MTQAATAQPDRGVYAIPAESLADAWRFVAPMLEAAVAYDTAHELGDVLAELQLRKWQLWVIGDFDGVVVTSIQCRPREKVLWVQYMAGKGMADWIHDWVRVQDEYAKHNECDAVEFQSTRKAWERLQKVWPDHETKMTIYRKRLTP